MPSKNDSASKEIHRLEQIVFDYEQISDFLIAKTIQLTIVQLTESDPKCTAGELGDRFHRLGELIIKAGEGEDLFAILAKALGFRRIFYGKGHPKVQETLEIIKDIRRNSPTQKSAKLNHPPNHLE